MVEMLEWPIRRAAQPSHAAHSQDVPMPTARPTGTITMAVIKPVIMLAMSSGRDM